MVWRSWPYFSFFQLPARTLDSDSIWVDTLVLGVVMATTHAPANLVRPQWSPSIRVAIRVVVARPAASRVHQLAKRTA